MRMARPALAFDPLAYRDPAPWPLLIRALGPFNRHVLLARLLRIAAVRVPPPDLARLRAAVAPGTVAFVAAHHPEFITDGLVDKEISRLASPLMAHWASWEIVNASPLAQWFWRANNLIANVPGGGGRDFSVRWARAGHGVLVHPEGTAMWQSDRVGSLLPGVVDMAAEAAQRGRAGGDARPVRIVPVVWKLVFAADAGPELAREIARIERALGLPRGAGACPERFAALQVALLRRACARLGLPVPPALAEPGGYFAAQQAVRAALEERLAGRFGPLAREPVRALQRLRRALRRHALADPAAAAGGRELLAEWQRLVGFDPALYGGPTLAQEQVAETLKRTRTALVTLGWRNALHNVLPVAVAPRIAHVRVAEPLEVDAAAAAAPEARAQLLDGLRARLQNALDGLLSELAPALDPYRRPNPLRPRP